MRLFVLLVICLSSLASSEATETCTWADQADTAGQQGDANQVGTGLAQNLDDCKTQCEARSECNMISFDNNGAPLATCLFFGAAPTLISVSPNIYSVKTCTSGGGGGGGGTTSCTMDQSAGTEGSSAPQFTISFTSGCPTLCKSVSECAAYSSAASTCKLFTADASTTTSAGSSYGTKNACEDGKQCCFATQSDMDQTGSAVVTLTNDAASCESLCLATSTCKASVFESNSCGLYTTLPSSTSANGAKTYSVKNCDSGATDGSYTLTSVCKGMSTTTTVDPGSNAPTTVKPDTTDSDSGENTRANFWRQLIWMMRWLKEFELENENRKCTCEKTRKSKSNSTVRSRKEFRQLLKSGQDFEIKNGKWICSCGKKELSQEDSSDSTD